MHQRVNLLVSKMLNLILYKVDVYGTDADDFSSSTSKWNGDAKNFIEQIDTAEHIYLDDCFITFCIVKQCDVRYVLLWPW